MTTPRYTAIADVAMTNDADVVALMGSLLERASRRQVWVTFLDGADRPLPVLIPTDVPIEPDPDDVEGLRDFFACLALDVPACTLVVTFERPGPAAITARDRRWLRLLREAVSSTEFPYCGPYLLVGDSVQHVGAAAFLTEPWLSHDED